MCVCVCVCVCAHTLARVVLLSNFHCILFSFISIVSTTINVAFCMSVGVGNVSCVATQADLKAIV